MIEAYGDVAFMFSFVIKWLGLFRDRREKLDDPI